MSVNKAILIGRLGKDPELRTTNTGKTVVNFSLATSRKRQGDEQTTWHNCIAWEKTAEVIHRHCKKGQEIYVEGRIDNRSYDKDGEKKYISEVIVEQMSFVGSKADNSGDQQSSGDNNPSKLPPDTGGGEDDMPF